MSIRNFSSSKLGQRSLQQRLLQDIAELQKNPYPNITLHIQDDNLERACLLLTVDVYGTIHTTVEFPENYPLSPPKIEMDSEVVHPNVFGEYICVSMLNTKEGWTPAYTLKAVAIQLLSFFSSREIEQHHGAHTKNLDEYRKAQKKRKHTCSHFCQKCNYKSSFPATSDTTTSPSVEELIEQVNSTSLSAKEDSVCHLVNMRLQPEILLLICDKLEDQDLMSFAASWAKVSRVITDFDVLRIREVQCFCLKKDYKSVKLGVGVNIGGRRAIKPIESEFDILSEEGFKTHQIRQSIQGLPFNAWLPLPISEGHWRKVKDDVKISLGHISTLANTGDDLMQVIYSFMNGIVVKLNEKAEQSTTKQPYHLNSVKSTLVHASEKAINSYFHLFHLLLCLAAEDLSIVEAADDSLKKFLGGATSKADVPNLGYLLIAALISNLEMTEDVLVAIVREAIIRNVVWMLDERGANMPELSYLEPSAVSWYRLKATFQAGPTSYRLLMFLNLFRRTAVEIPRKPLTRLRDEAFFRHGAPPRGSAKALADSIKKFHEVDSFVGFFTAMGISQPSPESFTSFLRRCIDDSVKKGYSAMPLNQGQALYLRLLREPGVDVVEGVSPIAVSLIYPRISFFPTLQNRDQNVTHGADGRGVGGNRGRGRGHNRGGFGGRGRGAGGRGRGN